MCRQYYYRFVSQIFGSFLITLKETTEEIVKRCRVSSTYQIYYTLLCSRNVARRDHPSIFYYTKNNWQTKYEKIKPVIVEPIRLFAMVGVHNRLQ